MVGVRRRFLDRFVLLISTFLYLYTDKIQLYQNVVFSETIPDIQKNKIVMLFSEMDKRLVDGSDEHLSMLDLTLRIAGILRGN